MYKIITDLCSTICIKHTFFCRILNNMLIPSWHCFKYWKKDTKERNTCTLNSSCTSKFRVALTKHNLYYFLHTISTSILLTIVWSYLIHYLTNFFHGNFFDVSPWKLKFIFCHSWGIFINVCNITYQFKNVLKLNYNFWSICIWFPLSNSSMWIYKVVLKPSLTKCYGNTYILCKK